MLCCWQCQLLPTQWSRRHLSNPATTQTSYLWRRFSWRCLSAGACRGWAPIFFSAHLGSGGGNTAWSPPAAPSCTCTLAACGDSSSSLASIPQCSAPGAKCAQGKGSGTQEGGRGTFSSKDSSLHRHSHLNSWLGLWLENIHGNFLAGLKKKCWPVVRGKVWETALKTVSWEKEEGRRCSKHWIRGSPDHGENHDKVGCPVASPREDHTGEYIHTAAYGEPQAGAGGWALCWNRPLCFCTFALKALLKAKAQLKVSLIRDVKTHKKGFYKFT